MADTITSNRELAIGLDYTDTGKNKTIYLKVPNPKDNLTESQIRSATETFINQQIVKDPTGEVISTTNIGTAYTQFDTKIEIDLN